MLAFCPWGHPMTTLSSPCAQACDRHKTSPTASAALGRALLGTLLMGAFREEGEKTQVGGAQGPGCWPAGPGALAGPPPAVAQSTSPYPVRGCGTHAG